MMHDCDVCTLIRRPILAIHTFTAGQHDYILMELILQKTTKECRAFTLNIQCRPKSKKPRLAALLHQEIAKSSYNPFVYTGDLNMAHPTLGYVYSKPEMELSVCIDEKSFTPITSLHEPARIPHSVSRDTCLEIQAFAKNAAQCS